MLSCIADRCTLVGVLKPKREYYNRVRPNHPINVLYAGSEKCEPGHRSEGARTHYLFHYVLDGTGFVHANGRIEELGPGDGFIFGPGRHHLYQASTERPWHYVWVGFTGMIADTILREANVGQVAIIRGPGVSAELRDHFTDLIGNLKTRSAGFTLRSDGYLLLILSFVHEFVNVADRDTRRSRETTDSYVNEAFNFIHANFQREIDVGSIVEYVGLERSYFSALFHRKTGQSVQQYLIGYRMRKAQEYLRGSGYAVDEIAASVGYTSYFSFARRFKLHTGLTPTEYRERAGG